MRSTGVVDATQGLGPRDHCCWLYDDPEDARQGTVEFLADGAAQHLRIAYLGRGRVDDLLDDLAGLPDRDALVASGALLVSSLDAVYGDGALVDPSGQVATYASATDAALADGYAGLRVAAEATALVELTEQVDPFLRYETLIDRYMTLRPFSAMCAYDRRVIGEHTATALSVVHPLTTDDETPFALSSSAPGVLHLRGAVDLEAHDHFARAVVHVCAGANGSRDREIVVDLADTEFIDHRALLALDDAAREQDVLIMLRNAPVIVGRVVELLGLVHVAAEPTGRQTDRRR